MKKIIEIKHIKEESYMISWLINNICTYACSYCTPDLYAGTNHHYDLDIAKKFIDSLGENIGHNKVHVAFSGGEPTVFPKFIDLVKYLNAKGWSVGITTNGSRSVAYFEELSKLMTYIAFSYHAAYHNEQFFEVIAAASKNCQALIRVMFDPKHWDLCMDTYNRILKNPDLTVEAVRLFLHEGASLGSEGKDVGYTPEQNEWLNTSQRRNRLTLIVELPNHDSEAIAFFNDGTKECFDAISIVNRKQNSFLGWECDIGKKQIFIDYSGRIKKGNCYQDGWATTVADFDKTKIFDDPTKCSQPFCYCVSDIKTPKRKIISQSAQMNSSL